MSTLGFAVLGLLARGPATGYDLARALRRPVGWFWTARHSQIYPALAALETAGLVEHDVVEGAGPRPTKRYTTTPAGLEAVREWLRATTPDVDPREILLRVYLVGLLPADEGVDMLRAIREHHASTLALYSGLTLAGRELSPSDPAFGEAATLAWGLEFERRRIAWVDGLIARLEAR